MADDQLSEDVRATLAEVAHRYFVEDRTKFDIAREMGISRFKVARLIDQARALGVVTITIHGLQPVDAELSRRLAEHLGLDDVVAVAPGDKPVREAVGAAAAQWLRRTLTAGDTLGLGWGRTLAAMVGAVHSLPAVEIVQLTGAVGAQLTDSPVELVSRAALTSGGRAHPIFAPLLVDSPDVAAALRRQPDIAAAMERYDTVTTAVVSIGSWDPPSSQLREWMAPADRDELLRRGVRAEVCALFVDDEGRLVGGEYADRCLSISADQLLRVPRVAAVAGGAEKARAVRATVAAGLVTTVICDSGLAEALLALPPCAGSRESDGHTRLPASASGGAGSPMRSTT